jgi:hypothetical protein
MFLLSQESGEPDGRVADLARAKSSSWEPTGRDVEIHVIDIVRVNSQRIVEHWNCVDRRGLLAQLGAGATPAAA